MVNASHAFQVFVKPIGAICNLNWAYCYYLKKKNLYPKSSSFRMTNEILENILSSISKPPQRQRLGSRGMAGSQPCWVWTSFARLWRCSASISLLTDASQRVFRPTTLSSMS